MIEDVSRGLHECNQHLEAATRPLHATSDGYYEAAQLILQAQAKESEISELLTRARQCLNNTKGPLAAGVEEVQKAWQSIEPLGLQNSSQELGRIIGESVLRYATEIEKFFGWPDRDVKMINGHLTLCGLSRQALDAHMAGLSEIAGIGVRHEDSTMKLYYQSREFIRHLEE